MSDSGSDSKNENSLTFFPLDNLLIAGKHSSKGLQVNRSEHVNETGQAEVTQADCIAIQCLPENAPL